MDSTANPMRLQRTYEVKLTNDGQTVAFTVNLAYDMDFDGNAVEHGQVVEPNDVRVKVAAVNRLRRLADKGKIDTDRETIDAAEWDVRLVRHRILASQ